MLIPHSYTATDECEIRNNWGMIACENNYGMVSRDLDVLSLFKYAEVQAEQNT